MVKPRLWRLKWEFFKMTQAQGYDSLSLPSTHLPGPVLACAVFYPPSAMFPFSEILLASLMLQNLCIIISCIIAYVGFHVVCCASFYGVHMHYNSHDYFLFVQLRVGLFVSQFSLDYNIYSQGRQRGRQDTDIFWEPAIRNWIRYSHKNNLIQSSHQPSNQWGNWGSEDGLSSHNHPAESASKPRCVRF